MVSTLKRKGWGEVVAIETSMKLRLRCVIRARRLSPDPNGESVVGRGLRGTGMGLGVPGVGVCLGSAALRAVGGRCCAPRWEMVGAAGMQGKEMPFLIFAVLA